MSNDNLMTMLREAGEHARDGSTDLDAAKARAVGQTRAGVATTTLGCMTVIAAVSVVVYLANSANGGAARTGNGRSNAPLDPGCVLPARVEPAGAAVTGSGETATLATVRPGDPVAVAGVLQTIRPATILDAEMIIGTQDSTSEAGSGAGLADTAALRPKNQEAIASVDSPPAGAQVVITATLPAGSYPVYYVINYVDTPACAASPGTTAQVMGQIGIIQVGG